MFKNQTCRDIYGHIDMSLTGTNCRGITLHAVRFAALSCQHPPLFSKHSLVSISEKIKNDRTGQSK